MIRFKHDGDFSKTNRFLKKIKKPPSLEILNRYGKAGVDALRSSTPIDTGRTADSWYYVITNENGKISISFNNSNVNDGVQIAIILQYGHGTRTGGWVEGRDYINPALQPIFDNLANDVWKEVMA